MVYVGALHGCERGEEDSGRNVDACAEAGELHDDVNSEQVAVVDKVAHIRHVVRWCMPVHAETQYWTFLCWEEDLQQLLAYYPREPSPDAMKDSMGIRDE